MIIITKIYPWPIVTIGSLFMFLFLFFSEKSGHGFKLFTVPYFFARSFRYTASYRHGYLDFQMYREAGVGDYSSSPLSSFDTHARW